MFFNPEFTPESLKRQQEAEAQLARRNAMAASQMRLLCCDLGRNLDRSTIIGLDCNTERAAVRGVEVFVRKDYNQLIDRLEVIREKIPDAMLVFDGTGVGNGVLDLFLARGMRPNLSVVITSGTKGHSGKDITGIDKFFIPKPDLIAYIVRLLNQDAIDMGGSGVGFEVLRSELRAFTATVRKTGTIAYEAPAGQHDDTISGLAIGLAAYSWLYRRRNKREARQHSY
jgi:hypothetical protein